MAKTYAISVQKGGQGKTRLTINLGAALADLGHRVLLIDLDQHGHLTEGLGLLELYEEGGHSVFDPMVNRNASLFDMIINDKREKLSIVPAEHRLKGLPQRLFQQRGSEQRLKRALEEVDEEFDYILIDCPPKDDIVTDNAIIAAGRVILPIVPADDAPKSLETTLSSIEDIQRELDVHIEITAIVLNQVNSYPDTLQMVEQIKSAFGNLVAPIEIRQRIAISKAWREGHSVFTYEPVKRNRVESAEQAQEMFTELAKFIINR